MIDSDLHNRVNGWIGVSNGDTLYIESKLRNEGFNFIAGVDEAGRGPLAGPVVAAAVVLPSDCSLKGVKDSKSLSAGARTELAGEIRSTAVDVGTGMVEPDEIDMINILQATKKAIYLAVSSLKIETDLLLIDGKFLDCAGKRTVTVVKGDNYCISIAAASIIAKVTRDEIMIRLHDEYPEYGFAFHKGYPTREHRDAIKKFGYSPVHRRSFNLS